MITTTTIHGLDAKKATDPTGVTVGGVKRDEEQLKILRVLVNMSDNRRCFDCTQPGPTYVNITVGAYVCTACSGRLRGLTPPHRLKSITMATFTSEEMEFLKSRGNEFCRRVWLARRLGTLRPGESVADYDTDKMATYLCDKYERQLWYQAPTEALYEEARQQSAAVLEAMKETSGSRGGQRGMIGCGAGAVIRQSNTMPDIHQQQQSMSLSPMGSVQRNTPILSTVRRPHHHSLSPNSLPPHHSLPPRPLVPASCNGSGLTTDSTWMTSGNFSSTPSSPWVSGSPWGAQNNPPTSPWIPTTPPSSTTRTSAFDTEIMEVNDPESQFANFANFSAVERSLLPSASSSANHVTSCPSTNQTSPPFMTEERRLVPPVPSDKYAALFDSSDVNTPPIINWSGSPSCLPTQESLSNQSIYSQSIYSQSIHSQSIYSQSIPSSQSAHYGTSSSYTYDDSNRTPQWSGVQHAGHCMQQYNQQLNPFMNGSLQHMNTSHNPFLS